MASPTTRRSTNQRPALYPVERLGVHTGSRAQVRLPQCSGSAMQGLDESLTERAALEHRPSEVEYSHAQIALLRAGGAPRQAAVAQLYSKYGRDFKRYFRRHGVAEAQAEDLLQETFIKVIRSIDQWQGIGTMEAWLWKVARNTLLSDRRRPAGVSLDDFPDEETLRHDAAAGDPAAADCVSRGLSAFSEKFAEYGHVLERVALDGWGYAELAEYRGSTLGAAREYLSQCRKRLWQFIAHCYEPAIA